MRQTIAIVILSVLVVVLSGCDKIKTELERRHLGAESYKQTAKVDNSFDDKRNNPEVPSARKQIIIRIDLPMEEKLQIRMIKLPVAEEKNNDVVNSPNESLKEDAPRADIPQSKDEKAVVPDKKSTKKLEAPKSEVPKTEIKTDVEQEPKSEMKIVKNRFQMLFPRQRQRLSFQPKKRRCRLFRQIFMKCQRCLNLSNQIPLRRALVRSNKRTRFYFRKSLIWRCPLLIRNQPYRRQLHLL